MSSHEDDPANALPPSGRFHERSDEWIAMVLGPDLQGATLRGGIYLMAVGVVLATIAALVG